MGASLGLPEEVRACLFDLNGVLTDTASVHRKAWKEMFDAYRTARAQRTGDRCVPFDIDADYFTEADDKKRDDGARLYTTCRSLPRNHRRDGCLPRRRECRQWNFTENTSYPLLIHEPYVRLYPSQVVKQVDLVLAMHWRSHAFTPEQMAQPDSEGYATTK
jgi:hypothetical protein